MNIGFIDYYLDEWHANNYPRMIREASGGEMNVRCAYAMIDSPLPGGRTTAQWSADLGIECMATIEQIVESSDALIVLSPDNCEMHEQLCQLPLRSGKPTYVDKTFAPDLPTARRIFDIAESAGTPCYSTSALRFAQEYQGISGVRALSAWGPNGYDAYAIHQIEPIMMLMGAQAVRVMASACAGYAGLLIEFADGRCANLNCFGSNVPFAMCVGAAGGGKTVVIQSDYFSAFIARLVSFFRTQSIPVSHDETLRIMAVRGAGLAALEVPGTWVPVPSV